MCRAVLAPPWLLALPPLSVTLLLFLDTNWARVKPALDVPEFHETIEAFEDYNQSVINKEGLALASQGCTVSIASNMNNTETAFQP